MTFITDEMFADAGVLVNAADDILFAADMAMIARGRGEQGDVVAALLAAAWSRHKELAPGRPAPFVELLRHVADSAEASGRMN